MHLQEHTYHFFKLFALKEVNAMTLKKSFNITVSRQANNSKFRFILKTFIHSFFTGILRDNAFSSFNKSFANIFLLLFKF